MKIKIFQLNGCEWWAAENLEQAIQCAIEETGSSREEVLDIDYEPYEVSDDVLELLKHSGDEDSPHKTPITFREELAKNISDGIKFPCLFATTEIVIMTHKKHRRV